MSKSLIVGWAGMSLFRHLVEVFFLLLAVFLWFQRAYKPRRNHSRKYAASVEVPLSKEEVDEICAKWSPEALDAPPNGKEKDRLKVNLSDAFYMTSMAGPRCNLEGGYQDVINLATNNFMGLVGNERIREACEKTLKKFGCGSCGPRGFYGTTDVHLACEKDMAAFLRSEEAILYSFGPATASSVVPAFAKRGDLIVADEDIGFSTQTGIALSRARVRWFKHNDWKDLERVLGEIELEDAKKSDWWWERAQFKQRRFIITEAVSLKHGDVAPIRDIVGLKHRYGFRLILDESFSIGVLGESGLGACEHFEIPRADVEITIVDTGNALASIGGICVGNHDVVSHQRLSGTGYCFSASQPPFLAVALSEAAAIILNDGKDRIKKLRENIATLREALSPANSIDGVRITSDPFSPIIHLTPTRGSTEERQREIHEIQSTLVRNYGVYVAVPRFAEQEIRIPDPGLSLSISCAHSTNDLQFAAERIQQVLRSFYLADEHA